MDIGVVIKNIEKKLVGDGKQIRRDNTGCKQMGEW